MIGCRYLIGDFFDRIGHEGVRLAVPAPQPGPKARAANRPGLAMTIDLEVREGVAGSGMK